MRCPVREGSRDPGRTIRGTDRRRRLRPHILSALISATIAVNDPAMTQFVYLLLFITIGASSASAAAGARPVSPSRAYFRSARPRTVRR